MSFTMKQLKQAREIIKSEFGLSLDEAGRAVASLSAAGRVDDLRAVLAGDLSSVPPVLGGLGISSKAAADTSSKTASGAVSDNITASAGSVSASVGVKDINAGSVKASAAPVGVLGGSVSASGAAFDIKPAAEQKARKTSSKARNKGGAGVNTASGITAAAGVLSPSVGDDLVKGSADDLQAVEGSAVTDNELPVGFGDRCCEWVEDFCNKHNLDITRLKSQQWRSACMYIGENIKASGVYRDRERERHEGGVIYSGVVLEKLLYLWAYLCGVYNQVPLASDFINFTGVSRGFFYDYDGRGLTAASVRLAQKAKQIEESGLGSSVAGGGAGAIGGMFLLKTRHGYSETVTIQHASPAAAVGVSDLPKLDIKSI